MNANRTRPGMTLFEVILSLSLFSVVMVGGLVAAFVGPEIAKHTRDIFTPYLFLGCYLAAACLPVLVIAVLSFVRIPTPVTAEVHEQGRPLSEIVRQPVFFVASAPLDS